MRPKSWPQLFCGDAAMPMLLPMCWRLGSVKHRSTFSRWLFLYNGGVLVVGVVITRARLFRVYIGASDSWKLSCGYTVRCPKHFV